MSEESPKGFTDDQLDKVGEDNIVIKDMKNKLDVLKDFSLRDRTINDVLGAEATEYPGTAMRELKLSEGLPDEISSKSGNKGTGTEVVETSKQVMAEIGELVENYNKKYNIGIKFNDLDGAVNDLINLDISDQQVQSIVKGDIISKISDLLVFNSIVVLGKVIMGQLKAITKTDFTETLNGEVLSTITQLFGWIKEFETLRDKYKEFDISRKISSIRAQSAVSTQSESAALVGFKKLLEAGLTEPMKSELTNVSVPKLDNK